MTATTQRTARDIALYAAGWNHVPVTFPTKVPVGDEWRRRVIREKDVPKYFGGATLA
jgi:hypothetical protein